MSGPGAIRHLEAVQYLYDSYYIRNAEFLIPYAQQSFTPARSILEAALDLTHRIHADFKYDSNATNMNTSIAEAFKIRRGVCQDFAHLLIGCLRMLGLPARYVSGYLLTHAPEGTPAGGAAMLGADASHAWVQVWCPGTPGVPAAEEAGSGAGWLSLDPTNNLVPGHGHVRVAVGRDYGDVTPLRGVIRGGGRHQLSVGVSTRVVHDDTALARPLHEGLRA
jgi:transglutaminase-like putative cysteine protease